LVVHLVPFLVVQTAIFGLPSLPPLLISIAPLWESEGWTRGIGWLYIASDLAISLAFVAVLYALAQFLRRRDGSTFHRLFALLGLFVFTAGASYFLQAMIFWHPLYILLGVVKLATALAAWCTVFVLFKMMPQLIHLPSLRVINQRLVDEIEHGKATEKELLRVQARYKALMDGTRVISWTADAEGKFVTPQVSWQLYTGQSWEEHQGFGWISALHEEDQVQLEQLWGQAVAARSLYRAEGRIWHAASESYHRFVVEAAPVFDEDAEVLEWFGTISDIDK
jgi:PAS domain S-box-containing protein